jgi:8-oxo-dGTP pyrophosphatase MutT (NUDIX family)
LSAEELLNVYDAAGAVTGTCRRNEGKDSGLIAGAVNALVISAQGEVLLQLRRRDKENGGLWDKTVGGHVAAGEDFDATIVREAGEELFDAPESPRVRLAADAREFESLRTSLDLAESVLLRRQSLQLNLRDVRHAPGRTRLRSALYHVAIYLGRSDIPFERFRAQASEIDGLRYVPVPELDRLLLEGRLAPNMAFLWLSQGRALLDLVGGERARHIGG